jgi:glycosyltransferase involved in cell wall biosynthesis
MSRLHASELPGVDLPAMVGKSEPAAPQPDGSRPQRVLLVSVHHPELVRGGAQQVCYELFEGLKDYPGCSPMLLAAIDDSTPALFRTGARITGFDGRPDEYLFLQRDYDFFWHKTSNPLLIESFAEFLRLTRPDVVHFHHFMNLGIDLLTLTRRVLPDCRIVFTFHEFLAICHAYGQMVRTTDRSLCTHASAVRCHQCFPERSPETFFVRKQWFQRHLGVVDVFTVPSRFMIKAYADWGIPPARIVHVPNGQRNYSGGFVAEEKRGPRNRFGFFGQLVDGKGVAVLLRAANLLRAQGFTDFVVEVNGDNLRYASDAGRAEFERYRAAEEALPPEAQIIVFNGPYQVDRLPRLMSRIDWCVVPSVWWEVFGLVISESWMFRRPVIASDVGGMAERIQHDVGGLLFAMGDPRALAATMHRACTETGLWERLVAGLPHPPTRETMVEAFAGVYRAPAPDADAD